MIQDFMRMHFAVMIVQMLKLMRMFSNDKDIELLKLSTNAYFSLKRTEEVFPKISIKFLGWKFTV